QGRNAIASALFTRSCARKVIPLPIDLWAYVCDTHLSGDRIPKTHRIRLSCWIIRQLDETAGCGTDNLKVARTPRATGHTSRSHIHDISREEKSIHMNTITKKILIDRIADSTGMK